MIRPDRPALDEVGELAAFIGQAIRSQERHPSSRDISEDGDLTEFFVGMPTLDLRELAAALLSRAGC